MNRINLITLGVKDLKRSLEFYRNIGFDTTAQNNDELAIVFFNNQGTKLELFPLDALAEDINEQQPPELAGSGFCGMTLAYNAKSASEVDAIMEEVQKHGAVIVKPAQTLSWGGYGGYFTDPDGYYWEVAYGEMWKFDENDMLVIE